MLFLNVLFLNTGRSVSFSWQPIKTSLFVALSILTDQLKQKQEGFLSSIVVVCP